MTYDKEQREQLQVEEYTEANDADGKKRNERIQKDFAFATKQTEVKLSLRSAYLKDELNTIEGVCALETADALARKRAEKSELIKQEKAEHMARMRRHHSWANKEPQVPKKDTSGEDSKLYAEGVTEDSTADHTINLADDWDSVEDALLGDENRSTKGGQVS